MEKIDTDAHAQASSGSIVDDAPPPSSRREQDEKDAAEAIAEISPDVLDALTSADPPVKLTEKLVTLADSIGESFREFAIGQGAWTIELTDAGMSPTSSRGQSLQHLRLRPKREGYRVVVAGTVNQVETRAELRDFDHVTILHEVRHRNALEITQEEWEQFLRKAETVLNAAGIQSMRTPPPRDLLEQRRSMQRVSKRAIVLLVVVLTLAIVVVWRVVEALSVRQ